MKILKLLSDFRPQRKQGAEIIGASILGGAGVFGTLMQSDINSKNLDYGAWQSEEQRNWATNERFASQMFNRNERLQTQEWNKPTHMAQMYRAAGLNPSVSSSTMASAASSPMSSSPVGSSAAAPGNSVVPNIPQLISSGADLVQALAKNTETKANLPLVNQQIEYLLQKTYGEEKANELKDLSVAFEKASMPVKVKQEFEKLSSLIIQNGVAIKQGKVFDAEVDLKKSQERLNDMLKNLKGEELVTAQFYNNRLQDIYDADMALKGAQTREANAKAVESGASARSHNASADAQELLNNVSRATNLYDIDNAIYNADTIQLLLQSNNKEELFQQLSRNIKNSSGYKNSQNRIRVDAALENLRKILGINVSVGVSNK